MEARQKLGKEGPSRATQVMRAIRAEIYNWFTEGVDTKDLQEAKELLEELA
jgi:hypothetical protein